MIVLAKDLRLPDKVSTETLLDVGKRGSGKTSTGVRLVEQLIAAGVPCAILDPADVWWGLKAPGRKRGLEVYVFGGRYADVPLEAHGGALLADVLVEQRISAVLSVRHLSGGERTRFVTDFANRLIARNTMRLHVVLEEAHELAPQNPQPGEQVMLGAIKKLWKLGRSSGIGGTAITQRPAALSKDITTQSEILLVHRLIGPQDVEAVRQWIKYHGQGDNILGQLGSLKTGEAFVWAPEFGDGEPIGLRRVQILPRDTFDSSATPDGDTAAAPQSLAPVDLERLREKMAETIKRAEDADPKRLRARVQELERELAKRQPKAPAPKPPREVSVLKPADIERLEKIAAKLTAAADSVAAKLALARVFTEAKPAPPPSAAAVRSFGEQFEARAIRAQNPTSYPTTPLALNLRAGGAMPVGERAVLSEVASRADGATRKQITVSTGYKRRTRDTYLQRLQASGYVEPGVGDRLMSTPAGRAALGPDFKPLPSGRALIDHWRQKLPEGERRIFEFVLEQHPQGATRDEITATTEYKRRTRDTYLQRLSARGIVVVGRTTTLAPELFA